MCSLTKKEQSHIVNCPGVFHNCDVVDISIVNNITEVDDDDLKIIVSRLESFYEALDNPRETSVPLHTIKKSWWRVYLYT